MCLSRNYSPVLIPWQVFLVSLLFKKVREEEGLSLEGCLFDIMAKGMGTYFGDTPAKNSCS